MSHYLKYHGRKTKKIGLKPIEPISVKIKNLHKENPVLADIKGLSILFNCSKKTIKDILNESKGTNKHGN